MKVKPACMHIISKASDNFSTTANVEKMKNEKIILICKIIPT